MMDLARIQQETVRLVTAHSSSGLVLAVYLFGSSLRTDLKDSSDTDLAFLVDRHRYKEDAFMATSIVHRIADGIGSAAGREADALILNSASLEMAHEIIATGFCLFEIDHDMRLEYEIKIKGMNFDFQPFLSELRARKIARLPSLET
jgi:predicted nucleotidyltransferase